MVNNFEQLLPFIVSLAGTLVFWLIAGQIFKNRRFDLGRGDYIGGLPLLGAMAGLTALTTFSGFQGQFPLFLIAGTALAFIGYLEDRKKLGLSYTISLILLTLALFFGKLDLLPFHLARATVWCGLIFICLKIAGLVYEMPFILVATSSLTSLLFFSQNDRALESVMLTWAILAWAIVFLLYSSTGNRVLTGSSGLACVAFALGTVSYLENSGRLMLFAMLIPSMVILFPVALISAVLIFSYFGNRLHDPSRHDRHFNWTLKRESTVVFSGLIFFCLNFLGLLVELRAPWYGYLALFVLLIASLGGFFKTFARRDAAENFCASQVRILDRMVDAVTPADVLARVKEFLVDSDPKKLMHIITADSLALLRCLEEERFAAVMERAELVVPDGAGIVWASDFLGCPLPGRVPGVALVGELARMSAENGYRVFLLGGKPGIAQKAADKLIEQNPTLSLAGIEHGYFKAESAEEDAIIAKIAASRAQIVLVALGVPRQEWFISRLRLASHKCVAVGVGGSFDVISETLPRAPVWMQRFGIEWLFRLWLEPFRFGRIAKIPAFVLQVLRYKWNN